MPKEKSIAKNQSELAANLNYQVRDIEIVDYSLYSLPLLTTSEAYILRGPQPPSLEKNQYFVSIGNAFTFGCFCDQPYGYLLQQKLGISTLNLGFAGAGPYFFIKQQKLIDEYVNNSQFAVILIMSGSNERNLVFDSNDWKLYYDQAEGKYISSEQAYQKILDQHKQNDVEEIVAETRSNWVNIYQQLLSLIKVPKILFWFSKKQPDYTDEYTDVRSLFSKFPQLVNEQMLAEIKNCCDEYVECVSQRGVPQLLINRFSGKPTSIVTRSGQIKHHNDYYATPEMHADAADALEKVCRKYVHQVTTSQEQITSSSSVHQKPETYIAQGNSLRIQGDIAAAIQAYEQALENQPYWAEVYANLGGLYAQQKQWQQAINYYQRAIALDPNLVGAYRNLARLLTQIGQRAKASDYWYRALKLEPHWAKAEEHFNLGKNLQEQGKLNQAIDCYHWAIELQPKLQEAYQRLGQIFSQQKQWQQLVNLIVKGIEYYPDDAQLHYYLAQGWAAQQQWQQAEKSYQQATEFNPQEVAIYLSWADTLVKQEKWGQAVKLYRQSIDIQPDFWKTHYQLGSALIQRQRWSAAAQAYRRAIELEPNVAWSHHKLGNVLVKQNKNKLAITAYRRAVELNPKVAEFYPPLAEAFIRNGQIEEAIDCLQQTIEIHPEIVSNYVQLAKIYRQKGDFSEAVNCYLQGITIDPNYSETYIQLRFNLLRYEIPNDSALVDEVIVRCQQLIAQKPELILAHSLLGYALTKQGKLRQAIDYYQIASYKQAQKLRPNITTATWETAERIAPKFMVIGGEKCGTTSLYHYINGHPQFLPSIEKELDFFDLEFGRGIDWYLAHFPPVPRDDLFLTGEVSANYIYHLHAPQRVWEIFPEIKLIVLLRNPVDRTVSRYHMLLKNGASQKSFEKTVTAEINKLQKSIVGNEIPWEILNRCRHIGNSLYLYHLQRWLNLFPKEQVLIIPSEDLYQNPAATLKNIFTFLDVKDYQLPEYKKYNSGSYAPISEQMREQLANFFRPHNQKLEEYLGRQFSWE